MPIKKTLIASLFLAFGVISARAEAISDSPYQQVVSAVTEVIATQCTRGDRQGSGFFWRSNTSVVTALHVISGCKSVRVRYRDQGEFSVAGVRFDGARDLAELLLSSAPRATQLDRQAGAISIGERLFVVGYPFSINTADALPIEVTPATATFGTLGGVLSRSLHQAAQNIGLDLSTNVVRVAPGIQPGASGAPVVNKSGELVGIGHGRLSDNTGAIGWVTRAGYLNSLNEKPRRSVSDVPDISAPYLSGENVTAASSAQDADAVRCGELNLKFRWRRTLGEIMKTHNDPAGLQEITKKAAAIGINLSSLVFRIWYEEATGGYIATPAEWRLTQQADRCTVVSRSEGESSVEILARRATTNQESEQFIDLTQTRERDIPRGMTMSTNLRIFNNEKEVLTNGATINRRAYQGRARKQNAGVLVTQTGFVRKSAAVVVLGRTAMTVGTAMSYGVCDIQKWVSEHCGQIKETSVEDSKAMLSAALSTVPES
jgi:S1-C subfamily serine protease